MGAARPDLSAFFAPRAVAVVGATANPTKWGYHILHNVLAGGFPGPVYPVSRSGGTLFGRAVVPSVDALPAGEVDLGVVVVPPDQVPACLEALGRRGVRAAYVVTGGYSETGAEGARLEQALLETSRRAGLLLAGPNGQGVLSTPAGLCAQMAFARPSRGGTSMVTQSGNLGASLMHLAEHTGVGFCRLVSVGNSAGLGLEDFLEWFAADAETRVIALYVEGVRDGDRFFRSLSAAAAVKPVVVLKGGRTPGGAAAALSHTGALAGRTDVFGQLCLQAGASTARSVEELFDRVSAFAGTPLPRGPRVGVVTVGGGWGVLAADAVEEAGLTLAPLPEEVRAKLDELLPARWSRRNPVDLAGQVAANVMFKCVSTLAESGAYDCLVHLGSGLLGFAGLRLRESPFFPDNLLGVTAEESQRQDRRLGEALAELAGQERCPVVFAADAAASPEAPQNSGLAALREKHVRVFPSPERAVAALAALVERGREPVRPAAAPALPVIPPERREEAAAVLRAARRAGRDRLAEDEAAAVLEAFGVPFARREVVDSPAAAVAAARRLGWPVVLKAVGTALAHKTERSLVRVGIGDEATLRAEAERLGAEAGVERLLVAETVRGRREVLAGLLRDPAFGAVGMLGFGGVLAEGVADVALARLPVDAGQAARLIGRLRTARVLGPFRGEAAADPAALARVLGALGALAEAFPCVAGADLNPLVVGADGAPVAVDALIVLDPAAVAP